MHPLRLDYRSSSVTWTRQGIACLLLGLALAGATGLDYDREMTETERLTETLMSVRQLTDREKRGKDRWTGEFKAHRAEIKEAETVLKQLTIPWDPLFLAVEQVGARHHNRIALQAVHPDVGERRVSIDGRAADLDVLVDFVSQLAEIDIITHAYLSHHQREEQDRERPILFSVVAEWNTRS